MRGHIVIVALLLVLIENHKVRSRNTWNALIIALSMKDWESSWDRSWALFLFCMVLSYFARNVIQGLKIVSFQCFRGPCLILVHEQGFFIENSLRDGNLGYLDSVGLPSPVLEP